MTTLRDSDITIFKILHFFHLAQGRSRELAAQQLLMPPMNQYGKRSQRHTQHLNMGPLRVQRKNQKLQRFGEVMGEFISDYFYFSG